MKEIKSFPQFVVETLRKLNDRDSSASDVGDEPALMARSLAASRAPGTGAVPVYVAARRIDGIAVGGTRLSRRQLQPRHRRDARQRLAAKP